MKKQLDMHLAKTIYRLGKTATYQDFESERLSIRGEVLTKMNQELIVRATATCVKATAVIEVSQAIRRQVGGTASPYPAAMLNLPSLPTRKASIESKPLSPL